MSKFKYYDVDGNERSAYWMVRNEPQWAAHRLNRVRCLEQQNKKLKEALEFYADEKTWKNNNYIDRALVTERDHEIVLLHAMESSRLGGKRARQVLKELDKE